MEWLLERLPVVIFLLVFVTQIVRAFLRSKSANPPPQAKPDELEQQRRVGDIQEQIRRRIAERRQAASPAEPPPLERPVPAPPPARRPIETTQMPDPFEGPLRRVMQEFEKRLPPPPAAPPPVPAPVAPPERRYAKLERQVQHAEEMRLLDEARILAERRAAQIAATELAQSESERGLRSAAHDRLLEDLRDPQSLRRAVVLREVLGPPVGLR